MKPAERSGHDLHGGRPPRGGRGLKQVGFIDSDQAPMSPPARGAWIETNARPRAARHTKVAPRAGGVD